MKKLKRVRLEDFNVETLMAAAREGRLYVDESKETVSREQVITEVRAYVARIKVFVTTSFSSSIDELWELILNTDEFIDFLMPGEKNRLCKNFNKYNLMRIIGVLREFGVYEYYSSRKFDALLEPDYKDSPYRRYLGIGFEQNFLLMKLKKIIGIFQL